MTTARQRKPLTPRKPTISSSENLKKSGSKTSARRSGRSLLLDHVAIASLSEDQRLSRVKEFAKFLGEVEMDASTSASITEQLRALSALLKSAPSKSKDMQRVTDTLVVPALVRGGATGGTPTFLSKAASRDVRFHAADCCFHVLKLHMPNSPFRDGVLSLLLGEVLRGSVVRALGLLGEVSEEGLKAEEAQKSGRQTNPGDKKKSSRGKSSKRADVEAAERFHEALELMETIASIKVYLLMLDLEGAEEMLTGLCGAVFEVMEELEGVVTRGDVEEDMDMDIDIDMGHGKLDGNSGPGSRVVLFGRVREALLSIVGGLIDDADSIPQSLLDVVLGHLAPSAMFGTSGAGPGSGGVAGSGAVAKQRDTLSSSFAKSLLQSRAALQPAVQKFVRQVLDGQTPADSDLAGNPSQLILRVHEASPQMMLPVMPNIVPSLEDGRLGDARRAEILDLLCSMFCESGKQGGGAINILQQEYPELLEGVLQRMKDQSAHVRKVAFKHVGAIVNSLPGTAEKQRVVKAVGELLCHVDERSRSMAVTQFCGIVAETPELVDGEMFGKLGQRLWDSKIGVRKAAAAGIANVIRTWVSSNEGEATADKARGLPKTRTALTAGTASMTTLASAGQSFGSAAADVQAFPYKAHLVSFIESLCARAQDATDPELQVYIEVDVLMKNGLFPRKMSAGAMRDWWSMIWAASGDKTKKVMLDMVRRSCQVKERILAMLQLRLESKVERTTRVSVHGLRADSGGADGHHGPLSSSSVTASDRLASMIKSTASNYLGHVTKADESLEKIFGMKDNNVFRNLETMAAFNAGLAPCVAASKELQARIGNKGPTTDCAMALAALMCPTLVAPEVLAEALRSAAGTIRDYAFVVELSKAEPRMFVGAFDALTDLIQSDDMLEATLAAEVLASAGKYMFANEKSMILDDDAIERMVEMCSSGRPKAAKVAAMALMRAIKFREDREEILERVCDGAWTALKNVDVVDDHPVLLSHVKVISVIMRMETSKLDLYAPKLHRFVMDHLMTQDLSIGRTLTDREDNERGGDWGRPSADVEIKAELIKAMSQAIVPIDCVSSPSAGVVEVAKSLCGQLQDLTDIDTASSQFESLVWKLQRVKWVDRRGEGRGGGDRKAARKGAAKESNGKKRQAGVDGGKRGANLLSLGAELPEDDACVVEVDSSAHPTDAMKLHHEKAIADKSPDAAWIRLAAAKSLLRLFRIYDRNFSGNDYLGVALSIQDPVPEVTRAILKKIDSNMSYLLRHQRSAQKRMAKTLALYSLYACDPTELNVKHAFHSMQRVIAKRRSAVAQMSLAKAASTSAPTSAADPGTLSNEMPEFALVYLVYLISHHPDYDIEEMAAAVAENASSTDSLVVLFKDTVQMFLEALMLPAKRPKNADTMTSTLKVNAGVIIKVLRQLKFCDIFDVENETVDASATVKGHQVCDIGLSLSRRLLHALSPLKGPIPSKFSGSLHLPSSYFHQKSLTAEDKRIDGSDLPAELRGLQLRDLFSEQCGIRMRYRTQAAKRKAGMMGEPSVVGKEKHVKSVKLERLEHRPYL